MPANKNQKKIRKKRNSSSVMAKKNKDIKNNRNIEIKRATFLLNKRQKKEKKNSSFRMNMIILSKKKNRPHTHTHTNIAALHIFTRMNHDDSFITYNIHSKYFVCIFFLLLLLLLSCFFFLSGFLIIYL